MIRFSQTLLLLISSCSWITITQGQLSSSSSHLIGPNGQTYLTGPDGGRLIYDNTDGTGTLCRSGDRLSPHQQSVWGGGFPVDTAPQALCDGIITLHADDSICVTGRVTYEQIMLARDRPMYAPSNPTISVNGHLITGSGTVVLGSSAKYIVDFVKSYEIDGVEYTPDTSDMMDNILAASRGTIDRFCLHGSIFETPTGYYRITSKSISRESLISSEVQDSSAIFVSPSKIHTETHSVADWGITILPWMGMAINNFFANIHVPNFIVKMAPGALGTTGTMRDILVNGLYAINRHPQPMISSNVDLEVWQLDCEWSTLMAAIDDGLFRDLTTDEYILPQKMSIVIKKISPNENTFGCWETQEMAAIDVQAPPGYENRLDDYVTQILYPALATHGDVGLHLGKRLVSESEPFDAAMQFYSSCGISTNLSVPTNECYHPVCQRSSSLTEFTYPTQYYN